MLPCAVPLTGWVDRYECAMGCMDKLGYVTETYGDLRHALYARGYFALPERIIAGRRRRRLAEKTLAAAAAALDNKRKPD